MIQTILKKLGIFLIKLRNNLQNHPITPDQLYAKIKQINQTDNAYIELLDSYYVTVDQKIMKDIVNLMPIKYQKYKSESLDCDNFAREFWVLATKLFPQLPIGYCHVKTDKGLHAANIAFYVNGAGKLDYMFIEPQTGKMSIYPWKVYLLII